MSDYQQSFESFGYQQELKRTLKTKDLVIFGMVFMSPLACMILFGAMTTISQGHSVLAYLIGFAAMLFTALSYGRMVEAFPIAGSTYSYTQRAIDPKLGFLSGWVMLLDYVLIPMLLFVISANFSNALIPEIPFWVWIVAYVLIVTVINIMGIEVAAKANFIMTGVMILAVIAFVIAAVKYALTGNTATLFSLKAIYNPQTFSIGPVMTASAMAVLSYLGFDAITTLTEEAAVPAKKVGLSIVIACIIQTVIYVSVAYFATLATPDYTAIKNVDTAFFDIALTVGGTALQTFVTLVIMVTGMATALAGQTAASRLLYGMGRDRLIPARFFAYLHPKYKTPTYSILFMAVLGLVGALTISFSMISEMITFGGLFGFICVNIAVVVHYFFKNKDRKIFSNLIFPTLGTVICVYIWFSLSPLAKIVGFSWLGIGIVYLVARSLSSVDFKALLEKNAFVNLDMAGDSEGLTPHAAVSHE